MNGLHKQNKIVCSFRPRNDFFPEIRQYATMLTLSESRVRSVSLSQPEKN